MKKTLKKLGICLIAGLLLLSNSITYQPLKAVENEIQEDAVTTINEQIGLLPDSMYQVDDVFDTYMQVKRIQEAYDLLSQEEKEAIKDYQKIVNLLDGNATSLNVDNINHIENSDLNDKTIGYLGSSITYGFRSDGISFVDYIQKMTGSTSIKQAITGGPLAKKEGVRDEISYITQLLEGDLTPETSLDALVVQLSTNDASLGIEFGELSESFDLNDFDYSTIYGAMEYIIAYAKQTWDCPVIFYTNPYLSDEAIADYVAKNGGSYEEVKAVYQTTYQDMVNALYDIQDKWDIGVIDMWNEDSFINIDVELRNYYMADPIHPTKAGYLFWYEPYIELQLEIILNNEDNRLSIDLTKTSENTYYYNAANEGYTSDYSSVVTPVYYAYLGAVTEYEAEKILDEMNIISHLQEWSASITVVTPLNNNNYNQADCDAFINLIGPGTSNIKVIGVDDGATFVNNYLSQRCYAIAGIMTYNGTMQAGLDYDVCLPAYLSNPDTTALDYYINANDAKQISANTYQNSNNTLQKVVYNNNETLAQAFKNAWDSIFSNNYRQHNEKTEFYMADPINYTDPYPLIGIAKYDDLKIEYNPIYNAPLNGEGKYTWFEYIPESTLEADNGTVPLVISLHGNGNDARLQGETTGWVELAATENFMVMAPEWQDIVYDSSTHEPGPNFFNCDGLEGDKLIEWIDMLKIKYPQIDSSRIYVTGLSAGGSASQLYGIKYSDTFAAVGAVSAPAVDKDEIVELSTNYDDGNVPMVYICGDHDFFGMIPVDLSSQNSLQIGENLYIQNVDPACEIFPVIQSYQRINGLNISENYDMTLNPYYGIALENQQWIKLGNKDALEGTLSNENGVIMKFAAIKDQAHWNYKPEAQYMWDFFKNYARDLDTGKLIIITSDIIPDANKLEENADVVLSPQTNDDVVLNFYLIGMILSLVNLFIYKKRKNTNILNQ